jgi:hypothetical protein
VKEIPVMQRILSPFIFVLLLISVACSGGDDANSAVNAPAGGSNAAVPAPAQSGVQVSINFSGSPSDTRQLISMTSSVADGANAWEAIKATLGESNLTFQDYGGSLGIFITGFFGVNAQGNSFWEFRVNGQSSDVGVSSYVVKPGDVLEFRYSS